MGPKGGDREFTVLVEIFTGTKFSTITHIYVLTSHSGQWYLVTTARRQLLQL